MIRVTVELVPHGVFKPILLGKAYIRNEGTGTPTRGNYTFEFTNKAGGHWKEGALFNFPRKKRLAWDLLYRCLKVIVGERNEM